jgi:hypothetical protein
VAESGRRVRSDRQLIAEEEITDFFKKVPRLRPLVLLKVEKLEWVVRNSSLKHGLGNIDLLISDSKKVT